MLCFAGTAGAGRLFVACKGTGSIQVYDTSTDKMEFEVKGLGEPHQVAVTPDGRYAFTGDSKGTTNKIFVIDEVPYTLSGKKMEVPVRRILLGQPVEKVSNPDAMRNPETIRVFEKMVGEWGVDSG